MPLVYAGIDEAGYGPLLGPLCVGMTVFHVEQWAPAPEGEKEKAPDLWKLLNAGVTRNPADRRRRIAVDDSKKLKLPNDSPSAHPLTHLERGVLSFLALLNGTGVPEHDAALFDALGAAVPAECWYTDPVEPMPCPATTTSEAVAISVNTLRSAVEDSGISVKSMRCQVFGETTYNDLVQSGGSKAAATEAALIDHLWQVWDKWGTLGVEVGGGVRVVCDRQGGREYYGDLLERAFPGVEVVETHHTWKQSRYELTGAGTDGQKRHMHVLFMVESETEHLPVALASMVAKHVRESLMARFNRHWCARMPELKPTAGYRGDAWRWLDDAAPVLRDGERAVLIRRS